MATQNRKYLYYLIGLLFYAHTGLAIDPDREYSNTPETLGVPYDEVEITTADGYKLNSWVLRPVISTDKKIPLILAYGDTGNMSYWLDQAALFVFKGYTVIMFDYRGFGKSQDFEMDLSYLYYNEFALDLEAVIRWVNQKFPDQQVGLWALSIGTISATLAMQNTPVDFLIGEGFVLDPESIQSRLKQYRQQEVQLPEGHQNYRQILGEIKINMLLFSAKKDRITSTSDSQIIARHGDKRRLIVYNGDHLEGTKVLTENARGDKYVYYVIAFLENNTVE